MDDLSLQDLIELLITDTKVHVCIHDLMGILVGKHLCINPKFTLHSKRICDVAKTTERGMRRCLSCKLIANNKAVAEGKMFVGTCACGITEIAIPVFVEDKVACIVYVGNLITDRDETLKKIKHTSYITGADAKELEEALDCCQYAKSIDRYINIAKVIKSYILLLKSEYPSLEHDDGHWVVTAMKNYISAYYDKNIKLSNLAKLYFLNEKYIGRLFKKETGMSFNSSLNFIRIKNAAKSLEFTEDSITRIAYDMGFANVTYFNKVFKKAYHLTPTQYRQIHNDKKTEV